MLRPSGGEKCRLTPCSTIWWLNSRRKNGLSASVGKPAGFKGGCTKRCVNEWKEVYLNPETKITAFSESRLGSRPGISHNIPQCVGKIRISPCRPSSAPAHCGNRDIGFMDASRPRLTVPGPQVSPSGEVNQAALTTLRIFPACMILTRAAKNRKLKLMRKAGRLR